MSIIRSDRNILLIINILTPVYAQNKALKASYWHREKSGQHSGKHGLQIRLGVLLLYLVKVLHS